MRLLVAPLHYVISETDGSEGTRAYEAMKYIAADPNYSGDILVGFSPVDRLGNFTIHQMFTTKPSYISILTRLRFILWIFITSLRLMRKKTYDCIWHLGPFALNETFSLLALWNRKKIRFVLGPIYTPHIQMDESDQGSFEKTADGKIAKLSLKNRIDSLLYKYLGKSSSFLSLLTLRSCTSIHTIDSVAKDILAGMGITHTQVTTMGIVDDKFLVEPRKVPKHFFHLLNVSYLVDRKRTIDLIEAVKILHERYHRTDFSLTIVGDGPQKESLEKMVSEYGVSQLVQFAGFVPRTQVHEFYKKSDIFLSASISDIMPGMYFEAMSASLPMVIAQNITAIELQRQGFGGEVVEGKNPERIAQAIIKIMNDNTLYEEMSKSNHRLMQTTYNFPKAMERLQKTFTH